MSDATRLRRPGTHIGAYEVSPLTDLVPIPVSPPPKRYPFAEMEPGDSFTIPIDRKESMRSALSTFRRRNRERLFVYRTEGSDRLRVWRTE